MADGGKPKRKPTTEATWSKVRDAYAAGDGSLADLAKRFKLNKGTVKTRALRESWVKGRSRIEAIVQPIVIEAITRTRAEEAERIVRKQSADVDALWDDAVAEAKAIKAWDYKEVPGKEGPQQIAVNPYDRVSAHRNAAQALKELQAIGRKALGMDEAAPVEVDPDNAPIRVIPADDPDWNKHLG